MELQMLNAIQMMRTPLLDVLMPLISECKFVWLILPVLLLLRKDTRRAGFLILTALILEGTLCNLILKNVFQRVRPCDVNTAIVLLVPRPMDYSFPSGHTSLSFAAVTSLWFSGVLRKWRIPALMLACLIAFSRMYLYLHYPTDILGGAALGVFCGWAAYRLFEVKFPKNRWLEVTA